MQIIKKTINSLLMELLAHEKSIKLCNPPVHTSPLKSDSTGNGL